MSPPKALALALGERLGLLARTLRSWPWSDTARTLRQRFREDRLGLSAGSLTFTTLIALVPLLTVMLAVFTAFPMFAKFQGALEQFLLQSLVPDSIAKPVLRGLTTFAAKASRLGTAGVLLLLVTALALMMTIDRTLNQIWRVRRPRPLAQRLLIYWAAITLGPLVLGMSLTVTSYALSASRGLVGALPGGVNLLFDALQFVLLATAMAGLFHFVPNTHVRRRDAWSGALFVAVGFELAKAGLAWYVERLGTFSAVYGTFATLPILLLWVYLGWVVVLLGAVVAAYAPSLRMRVVRRPDAPGQRFALALAMLDQLQRARHAGRAGATLPEMAATLRTDTLQLEPVLEVLLALGIAGRLDEHPEPRHVLLVDAARTAARPLIEALLLAPGDESTAFARHARFAEMTLAELVDATPAPHHTGG